jgi:Mg/Co/Ni transporter MgtE
VLLEMSAPSAAGLITAMDAERAAKLLGQAAPVTVAAILRNVPGDRRRLLLNQLTEPFRALVAGHLERAGLTSRR